MSDCKLNKKPCRINLFGGPGCGKSTSAAKIFSELKLLNVEVELCTEYAKKWAITKRIPERYDQFLFFGKQLQCEYSVLKGDYDLLVTDSPMCLSYTYTKMVFTDKPEMCEAVKTIVRQYEEDYPSIDIFLKRNEKQYHQLGRFHTIEEAKALDKLIESDYREVFPICKFPHKYTNRLFADYNDYDTMLSHILQKIGLEK